MPAGGDPVAAYRDRDEIVQAERYDRGPARRRPPHDHGPIQAPLKVPAPTLASRME